MGGEAEAADGQDQATRPASLAHHGARFNTQGRRGATRPAPLAPHPHAPLPPPLVANNTGCIRASFAAFVSAASAATNATPTVAAAHCAGVIVAAAAAGPPEAPAPRRAAARWQAARRLSLEKRRAESASWMIWEGGVPRLCFVWWANARCEGSDASECLTSCKK